MFECRGTQSSDATSSPPGKSAYGCYQDDDKAAGELEEVEDSVGRGATRMVEREQERGLHGEVEDGGETGGESGDGGGGRFVDAVEAGDLDLLVEEGEGQTETGCPEGLVDFSVAGIIRPVVIGILTRDEVYEPVFAVREVQSSNGMTCDVDVVGQRGRRGEGDGNWDCRTEEGGENRWSVGLYSTTPAHGV